MSDLEMEYRTPNRVSFSRRTPCGQKYLILLVATLFLIVVVLAVLLLLASRAQPPDNNIQTISNDTFQSMCLTDTCIHTASEMYRSLDRKVDPCDDFYDFACGGWIKDNPIPEGKSAWGRFEEMAKRNQLILRNALEKVVLKDQVKSKAEQKARIYYKACLDLNKVTDAIGAAPLQEVIRNCGGWNISASGFLPGKINLKRTLWILQNRYGVNGFFTWSVEADARNSSRNVITVKQATFEMPYRDNYLNRTVHNKILDAYLEFMTKTSVLLGANETDARTQMLDVIEFETDLANITATKENEIYEDQLYHAMSVQELQELSPFIKWQDFFNNVFGQVSRKIGAKEIVVVKAKAFLVKLNTLVNRYAATERGNNTLNNYLIWQAVKLLSPYLSKDFRDAKSALQEAVTGSEGGEVRWRHCVTETDNAVGFATGAMFVRESFSEKSKSETEDMIANIREVFKKNLQTISWLDKKTRDQAVLKEEAITEMIGFPDYILNPQELDKHYFELEVKPNEYFQNDIEVRMFNLRNSLKKLDKPVNKTEWEMTPATVNAYYNTPRNQICFPAGILQFPFYENGNPKSVNYGAIGTVMGHELTHAFDNVGRTVDRFGNLNNWWTNESIHQFDLRTTCIQEQYSNYSEDGIQINGKLTSPENIADNGGLKTAFHAYLEYATNAAKNHTLPGLNYSHRQLFFISFAQAWCQSITKEQMAIYAKIDVHSFNKIRIIVPLSNLPEFSQEFNCTLGSNMNPVKKCRIW